MKSYSAIILAAGYSTRMGSFKPLMKINGKTPIQRCVELFENCGISDITVVTGHMNDDIVKELSDIRSNSNDIRIIFNDKYSEGMYSSIKAGVESLPKETNAFFILPVDIPSVQVNTIKKMLRSYEKIKGGIIHPTFGEEKGHPVLVSSTLAEEILNTNPEGGLKELFNKHKKQWHYVQVTDRGILLDMDTKEDFQVLLDHISVYPCPDYQECMEILKLCKVNRDVINHMKSVAQFAKKISFLLNKKGLNLDLNLNYVYAGALLHDVAKGKKDHAEQGAKVVEDFGYKCLMEIINEHMELKTRFRIGEKEVVYLCDKLIKERTLITLKERFAEAIVRYEDMPHILENVNKKYLDAKMIKKSIEEILGISIETLSEKF